MLRRSYAWILSLSAGTSAPWALGAVAFAESSVFPVPPDVLLIPMALARPERAWLYAAICTAASVAGGLLGYAIGALLYDSIGHWLFRLYGLDQGAEAFRETYARWGALAILIKGVTPIPFKLVTITSGFAGYDLVSFTLLSLLTRGARFALVVALVGRYGPSIRHVLDRHLGWAATILAVVLIGGFALLKVFG